MPIVAIILGVIIIILGAMFFFGSNEKDTGSFTPADTAEINRTEETEVTETEDVKIIENDISTEIEAGLEAEITTDDEATIEISKAVNTKYTSIASYITPARTTHEMNVELEITDGVVSNVNIKYDGKDQGFSNPNQERFDNAYKTEVIGKKLEEINLSRVGGASLTSQAFNEAIANIKNDTTS